MTANSIGMGSVNILRAWKPGDGYVPYFGLKRHYDSILQSPLIMGKLGHFAAVWVGFFGLAMINGIFREAILKPIVGEPWAHHLSAASAIMLFFLFAFRFRRYLDIRTLREALGAGVFWLALTVLAETFLIGRLLSSQSWDTILANYDLLGGNLWPLVVLFLGFLPTILYLQSRKRAFDR